MSVLHIDSSARVEGSNTRILSQYLVKALNQPTVYRDLGQQPLPPILAEDMIAVHGSFNEQRQSFQSQLDLSNLLIDELRQSNTLVIAAPMYNFSIPANLKRWIDAICRAGVSFKYTETGPQGLLGVQRAFLITGSGGTPIGSDYDFASRYLEHICRFIGIEEISHIHADGSKHAADEVIQKGMAQIDQILSNTVVAA